MYRNILFPTDGSPGTEAAAEQAIELAALSGATLHVLFVVDAGALPVDAHAEMMLQALENEGRAALREVTERAEREGCEVTAVVREGVTHRGIIDYADENDCDLVVMATHARRGIDRALLGSVTERVLRLSSVPVLAVPIPE